MHINGRIKAVLFSLIILAVIAAGYAGWQRHIREVQNNSVEIAVVYDQAEAIARSKGFTAVQVLEQFRRDGATAVLVKEPTLAEAVDNGEFMVMTGLQYSLGVPGGVQQQTAANQIAPGDTVLITRNEETFDRTIYQFTAKDIPFNSMKTGGQMIIWTPNKYLWLVDNGIGLGIPQGYLADIEAAGLRTIVQLRSWPSPTEDGIDKVFAPLKQIDNLSLFLFNDEKLPGPLPVLAEQIKELNVPLAQVEFFPQQGLNQLGYLLDKKVVRLHSIPQKEAGNYIPRTAADRFILAASERNMRVLLVHDLTPKFGDPLEYNKSVLEKTRAGLLEEGLTIGKSSMFEPLPVSRYLLALMGLGVIAGGMLLLSALGLKRLALPAGVLALLLWLALLGTGQVNPGRKLMALGAVTVFPTLAVITNLGEKGVSPLRAIMLLLRMSLVSLIGAVIMVGLLADTGFMLKLDQFAGVKLAHLLPLALVGLFYFFTVGRNEGWVFRMRKIMDQPVTVKLALVAAVVGLAGLIYLLRTGNEAGVAVSAAELKVRALLDNLLQVRPRTKEFALGHPLMLLLLYLGYRDNRYLPLLLGGVIGQISLVNTYAHIHTPVVVSLLRSFNGLWLSIILGLVLIAAWRVSKRVLDKHLSEDT